MTKKLSLVEKLRWAAESYDDWAALQLCKEAADEIERLTARWDKLMADCLATPCKYPSLRDDLTDWMEENGIAHSQVEPGDER